MKQKRKQKMRNQQQQEAKDGHCSRTLLAEDEADRQKRGKSEDEWIEESIMDIKDDITLAGSGRHWNDVIVKDIIDTSKSRGSKRCHNIDRAAKERKRKTKDVDRRDEESKEEDGKDERHLIISLNQKQRHCLFSNEKGKNLINFTSSSFGSFIKLYFTCLTIITLINSTLITPINGIIDPDERRDASGLIESRGFIPEIYHILTSDGYVLELHRIVNPLLTQPGKPVILQHGLIASSTDFLINCPGEGLYDLPANYTEGRNLGFSLARLGYDVWLGNSRGNTYCRNHTTWNPNKDKQFWEFTWDEHAMIDLPATIDFVLQQTNSRTVGYVGHSQGTLIMFALLSTQTKYNDIIRPFIALAPISSVASVRSPIRYLANNAMLLDFFKWRGGQFLPSNEYIKYLAERVCDSRYMALCSNLLFMIQGFDVPQLNMTRVAVYYTHTPAGTSAWNMIHYAQGVKSGKIQMFDYGKVMNLEKYGQEVPPEYHLERITNRYIALMMGLNDWLSDVKDCNNLRRKLRVPLIMDYTVDYEGWNHLDFIWGKDAGKLINSKVVKLLQKYA